MSESTIARRYAKALMELCTEADNRAVIGKQLSTFAETYKASEELQGLLINPVIDLADKQMVLNKLFEKFLFANIPLGQKSVGCRILRC